MKNTKLKKHVTAVNTCQIAKKRDTTEKIMVQK